MTKKQAYKIIEKKYKNYDGSTYIYPLCGSTPVELIDDWCEYWYKINTKDHTIVDRIFLPFDERKVLTSLTRLMLLHDFIEDTYD